MISYIILYSAPPEVLPPQRVVFNLDEWPRGIAPSVVANVIINHTILFNNVVIRIIDIIIIIIIR